MWACQIKVFVSPCILVLANGPYTKFLNRAHLLKRGGGWGLIASMMLCSILEHIP